MPSPRPRVLERRLDQLERLGLVAAPGGEHQRAVHDGAMPVACVIASISSTSAAAAANSPACTCSAGAVGERDRQHGQRAGLAGERTPRGGERVPDLVVPQVLRDAAARATASGCSSCSATRSRGTRSAPLERRRAGRVALCEQRRQAVEEQVARRARRRRRGAGGLRPPPARRPIAETAGEHRRGERLQVRLARQRRVERLEPPGGVEQQRRRVAAAPQRERDLRAQPVRAGRAAARRAAPARAAVSSSAAASGAPARRAWPAPPPARAPRAQAGSGVSSAARSRNAAAAARPPRRLRPVGGPLELGGDLLVGRRRSPCARCQARRSGSASGSVASASARCTAGDRARRRRR